MVVLFNYSQGLTFASGTFPKTSTGVNFRYNGADCVEYLFPENENMGVDRINKKRAQHDQELERIPLGGTLLTVAPTDCGFDLDMTDVILDWPSQSSNPSVIAAAPSSPQNPDGTFVAIRTPGGPGAVLDPGGGSSGASASESTSYAAPFVAGVAALSVAQCPSQLGPNLRARILGGGSFLNAEAVLGRPCP